MCDALCCYVIRVKAGANGPYVLLTFEIVQIGAHCTIYNEMYTWTLLSMGGRTHSVRISFVALFSLSLHHPFIILVFMLWFFISQV